MILNKVISAFQALNNLASQPLPYKDGYRLHKLRGQMNTEVSFFITARDDIFKRYSAHIEGNVIHTAEENKIPLVKELDELLNTDVQIDGLPVKLSAAPQFMSVDDLTALEGFVEFPEINSEA